MLYDRNSTDGYYMFLIKSFLINSNSINMKAKKFLNFCLCFFISLPFITACSESEDESYGIIGDFTPIEFYIYVQDTQGNDLLNPQTEGNILGQEIKAVYHGKEYPLNATYPDTRVYLASSNGLQLLFTEGYYLLCFGELQGESTYNDETITLYWGDGSSDIIRFSSRLQWKSPTEPEFDRQFFLNDVKHDNTTFVITRQPSDVPAM